MRVVKVQPAAFVDNMWLVGRDDPLAESYSPDTDTTETVVGTRLPYPFFADEAGQVLQEVFEGWRVVGFLTTNRSTGPVDLWWRDAYLDPERAVGMYVVTQDDKGVMSTHQTAIESVEVLESGDPG